MLAAILTYGQNTDSTIKVSTKPVFIYDHCDCDGKFRTTYSTKLNHYDSTKCFHAYVFPTNRLDIFNFQDVDLTGNFVESGFVTAIKCPRKFFGIILQPKKFYLIP